MVSLHPALSEASLTKGTSPPIPPPVKRRSPEGTAKVILRWHGLGAMLAVAFYSLFFSAHLKFENTPIYIRDSILFGAQTQTVFLDLSSDRTADHSGISALHPAFTLIHQPLCQVLIRGWRFLGQSPAQAARHGVASLTCLVAALTVVMVYHTLLWSGAPNLRALLMSMIFGAGTCAWITAPLPETWLFAGAGVAAMAATTARGSLAKNIWHLLAPVYAISCFVGNVLPCLILAMTRCAQDRAQTGSFRFQPLLMVLVSITLAFGLANAQRWLFPHSVALPRSWQHVMQLRSDWEPTAQTAPLLAREVFVSNIVAPAELTAVPDQTRSKIVLNAPQWSSLGLREGLSGAWLLLLCLAFAGIVWRAPLEAFPLGLIAVLAWCITTVCWYGNQERLLIHACLWTPVVVMLAGLGLEKALQRWRFIATPMTFFMAVFVSALLTRNWMFLMQVAAIPGR